MRTLKKTLCLVLAVVMILGLGVIGVSAKEYTDGESVQHKEAVEVLSAVNVFEGDENGAFNGSKALTRAEGAAVVTRLLGVENPNGATTFADTENHWAKGYIAYCADLGIMNGYGDGNFGPDDPLTGAAFAKFLLVALGYNPNQENMTGASWEIGVTKLVNVIDLAHDMGSLSYTGAITRDDAAKMAYNCLTKNMVEYLNNKTITAGDVSVVENSNATPVKNTSYSYKMSSNAASYTGRDEHDLGSTAGLMQFVENYFPNLKLENKNDDFGVSQNYWYLASSRTDYTRSKDEDIVKEAADDLLATYTDAVTPKTIRDAIGGSAVDALAWNGVEISDLSNKSAHLYVYIDGVLLDEDTEFTNGDTDKVKHWAGTKNGSNENIPELGRGVVTRVYRNADTQDVTIVVNGVYLAKAVANFDGDELPIEIYNNESNELGGIETKDGVKYVPGDISYPSEIKQEDVDVSSFQKDDYLLITMTVDGSDWKVRTVELAETVEDVTLNSFRNVPNPMIGGPAGNIVAGGKFYMFNLSAEVNAGAKGYKFYNAAVTTSELKANDNTYKLWLDKNGYVVGMDEVESTVKAEDYLYVTAETVNTLEAKAKVVFLVDGTEKTITVNKLIANGVDHKTDKTGSEKLEGASNDGATPYSDTNGTLEAGHFYKFKEKSSGEYELTKVTSGGTTGIHEVLDVEATMKASSSTPLVGQPYSANAKSVAVADKKTFVGVRNFPDVNADGTKFQVLLDGNTILAAYTDKVGSGNADKDQYALLIKGPATGKDGDDTIYTYDAVINGEMTRVIASDDEVGDGADTAMYEISTTTSKGYVKIRTQDLIKSTDIGTTTHDLMMAAYKATTTTKVEAQGSDTTDYTDLKTHYLKVEDDVLKYDQGDYAYQVKQSVAVVDDNTKYYEVDCTTGHAATIKTISDGSVGNLDTSLNWLIYAVKEGSKDKAASVVYFVKMDSDYRPYTIGYDYLTDLNTNSAP